MTNPAQVMFLGQVTTTQVHPTVTRYLQQRTAVSTAVSLLVSMGLMCLDETS
jgi:hypothetical protein